MPTIKDVAKEAGVSIATVSYVLNNRLDMVGEKTRLHVLETAQRLGYRPNITAKNLQSNRTNLIGYAWHKNPIDQPNLMMNQFIYSLAEAAAKQGFHLLTFTHPDENPIQIYENLILSRQVDAFVLANTAYEDRRIRYLMERKFPFVAFGRSNPEWDFEWVDTDGRAGMRLATEYLLQLGHRNIAFLGWPKESLSGGERLAGYKEALQSADLNLNEAFIIHNDYINNSIEAAFTLWQTLPPSERPTALIAVSDDVGVAAMRVAEKFGYTVGETFSIIGFDDAPFVRYIQPTLTTMRQPLEAISDNIITRVKQIIEGDDTSQAYQLLVPELIIRESTSLFSHGSD